MLTKNKLILGVITLERMGTFLNKQQKLFEDLKKERIRKLHIECNKYIEIPSYLKRELAEIEYQIKNKQELV